MVYSNSWGPPDYGFFVDGPGDLTELTFSTGAQNVSTNNHMLSTEYFNLSLILYRVEEVKVLYMSGLLVMEDGIMTRVLLMDMSIVYTL